MKKIIYICNYMLEDVIEDRNNSNIYSQAANNKINGIVSSLEKNNCEVNIISNGLVNNRSLKYYKKFSSRINKKVTYTSILDIPIINIISSIVSILNHIRLLNKNEKIDYIMFYNYRPETAIAAWLSKKIYRIPIILDYEDGYFGLCEISNFKRTIINCIEKFVSKKIDGAILVTSKLKKRVSCNHITVRGLTNNNILNKVKSKKNNTIPTIMYSGGLEKVRGIEILLDSLKFTDINFKLLISGKGECEDLINECTDERVEFLGYIDYDKVIEYMINADILINCQLEHDLFGQASFPSKLFEYISTTNIIISSEVSDVKEFFGSTIHLYKSDDPKELAKQIDKITCMLNNREFINKERQKVYKFAIKNTPENIGKELINTIFI